MAYGDLYATLTGNLVLDSNDGDTSSSLIRDGDPKKPKEEEPHCCECDSVIADDDGDNPFDPPPGATRCGRCFGVCCYDSDCDYFSGFPPIEFSFVEEAGIEDLFRPADEDCRCHGPWRSFHGFLPLACDRGHGGIERPQPGDDFHSLCTWSSGDGGIYGRPDSYSTNDCDKDSLIGGVKTGEADKKHQFSVSLAHLHPHSKPGHPLWRINAFSGMEFIGGGILPHGNLIKGTCCGTDGKEPVRSFGCLKKELVDPDFNDDPALNVESPNMPGYTLFTEPAMNLQVGTVEIFLDTALLDCCLGKNGACLEGEAPNGCTTCCSQKGDQSDLFDNSNCKNTPTGPH